MSLAIVLGVIQFTLDRHGAPRRKSLPPGPAETGLQMIDLVLLLLSELGLVVVCLWSAFSLEWSQGPKLAFGTLLLTLAWGFFVGQVDETAGWKNLIAKGRPVVLTLQILTAACVVLVVLHMLKVIRL